MKKLTILVLVAENFEEIELVTAVDVWRRSGYDVTLASVTKNINVTGQQNLTIITDKLLEITDTDNSELLFIPGGAGYKTIQESALCMSIIEAFVIQKKYIAAICAGPIVLSKFLGNKKVTCYPALKNYLLNWQDQPVVHDDIFITSQGAGTALDLAYQVVSIFDGEEKSSSLKNAMIYHG